MGLSNLTQLVFIYIGIKSISTSSSHLWRYYKKYFLFFLNKNVCNNFINTGQNIKSGLK